MLYTYQRGFCTILHFWAVASGAMLAQGVQLMPRRYILLAESIRFVILSAAKNPLGREPAAPRGRSGRLRTGGATGRQGSAGQRPAGARLDPLSNGFFAALRMTCSLLSLLTFIPKYDCGNMAVAFGCSAGFCSGSGRLDSGAGTNLAPCPSPGRGGEQTDGAYEGVSAGPSPAPEASVGEGSALDAVAARVSRDPAPGRAASIARAAPSPTVRMSAYPPPSPPMPADSCSAPRWIMICPLLNPGADRDSETG